MIFLILVAYLSHIGAVHTATPQVYIKRVKGPFQKIPQKQHVNNTDMAEKKKIVVIGAGVSGLTSALKLLESGYDVTIVARSIPGETDAHYASPYAGANWHSFGGINDHYLNELDKPSYLRFLWLAENEPRAAVHIVKQRGYIRRNQLVNDKIVEPWFKDFVKNYKLLSKEDVPSGFDEDIIGGYECDSITISTTLYLNYLLQEVFKLGGILKRQNLKHINDAYSLHHSGERAHLVVNASGLLSRFLGGVEDKDVYPIRGQIVRIRNNFPAQISVKQPEFEGESFYAHPRKEGGGIVGGTFIPNNWSTVVDPEVSKRIIERAKKYIPEILDPAYGNGPDIDVIDEYVGLRPARKGNVRIERVGSVVHNYGIGAAGYQASYGLAQEVVRLAGEYFRVAKL